MRNAGDSGDSETFEELVEQTRGPRARIIEGLRFYAGEGHAQQLRRYGDVPSGRYHFNKLQEQGIIEKAGEEHVGRGGTATVYQLTDLGHEIADALEGSSGAAGTIMELENRIDQLTEGIEDLQQAYNEIAGSVEKHGDDIDALKQAHNGLADHIEDLDERIRDTG